MLYEVITMPFVEPPSAIITTMAFSNASLVAMSRARFMEAGQDQEQPRESAVP